MVVGTEGRVVKTVPHARWRTIVESDFEQDRLDGDHEDRLD